MKSFKRVSKIYYIKLILISFFLFLSLLLLIFIFELDYHYYIIILKLIIRFSSRYNIIRTFNF